MSHRVASSGKLALLVVSVMAFLMMVALDVSAGLPDPLFYVPFNGTENAVISGGSSAGKLEGGAFVAGIKDRGILLEGEDRCTYSVADNFSNLKGTVMMWVKPKWKAADKKGSHFFFGVLSDGWADNNMVFIEADGGLNEGIWNPYPFPAVFVYMRGWFGDPEGTVGRVVKDVSAWQAEGWHHIAHTWDLEQGQYLYIDGELVDDMEMAAPSGEFNFGPDMYIGSLPEGNSSKETAYVDCTGSDAVIDEFYIYDEMLTAGQIRDYYLSTVAVDPNGMLAVQWGGLKRRISQKLR